MSLVVRKVSVQRRFMEMAGNDSIFLACLGLDRFYDGLRA